MSNEQLNRFNLKGGVGIGLQSSLKVIPEATMRRESELASKKTSESASVTPSTSHVKIRMNRTVNGKKARNLISDQGPRHLGYDVQKFISFYL